MGTGKSSIGRRLANVTGWPRFDTDQMIATGLGMSITRIFAELGEEQFRDEESIALERLDARQPSIIVTGGGVVLRPKNVARLHELGTVVCLTASFPTLLKRLARRSHRPLLETENRAETVRTLLRERQPLYEQAADMTIDTTSLNQDQVAQSIKDSLPPPTEIKAGLLRRAAAIGFDDCRLAQAAEPRHANDFRAWLDSGSAAEMDWIGRGAEKRCDPQKVLPGARSVIALAMNYWQGDGKGSRKKPEERSAQGGRIARYAWGDDYHDVLEKKLRELDAFLAEAGGRQKFYVDTGPVLERDFAAEAGIGWHGKSTMLLNRQLGTWFFLAEIFTTLELPVDPPVVARCGSCTRCIDACPTGAITAPHQLDARRCISYLTIELKGSIPLEFRPLIGDRIYGCDDCLDACPWNRFAQVSRESKFAARPAIARMRLRDFLALNEERFREIFRGSPIRRIKRRGFLRNICVALGNVGTKEDLPALAAAARDREPLIAEHAVWAIKQIQMRSRIAVLPHVPV